MPFQTIDVQELSGKQVIFIPENLKIEDSKVYLKKVGDTLYIIPFHNPWQVMFDSLKNFSVDFMEDRGNQNEQNRELLD